MLKESVEAPEAPVSQPVPIDSLVEPAPELPSGAFVEADLLVEDVSIDGMCGVY